MFQTPLYAFGSLNVGGLSTPLLESTPLLDYYLHFLAIAATVSALYFTYTLLRECFKLYAYILFCRKNPKD
jgi:hypothetical protein